MRAREFMSDRLRRGRISRGKFISALNMAKVALSPVEKDVLLRELEVGECGEVAYERFVKAIDGGDERLEMHPTREMRPRQASTASQRAPSGPPPELEAILQPMRAEVALRQIMLKDQCRRYDRQNIKAITLSQFRTVLKLNGLLPNQQEQALRTLHTFYPCRHAEKIDYQSFCEDVESPCA